MSLSSRLVWSGPAVWHVLGESEEQRKERRCDALETTGKDNRQQEAARADNKTCIQARNTIFKKLKFNNKTGTNTKLKANSKAKTKTKKTKSRASLKRQFYAGSGRICRIFTAEHRLCQIFKLVDQNYKAQNNITIKNVAKILIIY